MKLNGHELESKYVAMVIILNRYSENTFWNRIARRILKKKLEKSKVELKERLKKLEKSFNGGFISDKAYVIWKDMIKNALKIK